MSQVLSPVFLLLIAPSRYLASLAGSPLFTLFATSHYTNDSEQLSSGQTCSLAHVMHVSWYHFLLACKIARHFKRNWLSRQNLFRESLSRSSQNGDVRDTNYVNALFTIFLSLSFTHFLSFAQSRSLAVVKIHNTFNSKSGMCGVYVPGPVPRFSGAPVTFIHY